ncbi:hypothetical protein C943_03572 [Mariniradius saccharolyticus AK6]|uniref:Uncharacterized protein n=1 Tax=Mariniradius saccharolyticus AK6 TaxID=1239962 RepID=M7XIJ3_9BACT|nr:hypothetical protein C943_03572 [Mariniradius saccharolyticus AK6]
MIAVKKSSFIILIPFSNCTISLNLKEIRVDFQLRTPLVLVIF